MFVERTNCGVYEFVMNAVNIKVTKLKVDVELLISAVAAHELSSKPRSVGLSFTGT